MIACSNTVLAYLAAKAFLIPEAPQMFFPKKCTLYGLFLPGLEYVNIIQKKTFLPFLVGGDGC